jgi:hypothetical protein
MRAFIVSFEHFYERPFYSYIGSETLHTLSVDLESDCHKLCDAFLNCESVYYDEIADVYNCKILGGNFVRLENETAQGIEIARDVTLFTKGFSPEENDNITRFANIFDLDECKALCEVRLFVHHMSSLSLHVFLTSMVLTDRLACFSRRMPSVVQ